jgi:hypothetical protein
LMGIAGTKPEELGRISAEILSASVHFLIENLGHEEAARIMRDWAGFAQRLAMKAPPRPPLSLLENDNDV